MKIIKAEVFDIKVSATVRHGWNPICLRLTTDEGLSGLGEVALAYGTGASAGWGMVKNLCERFLIGADPFQVGYLWDRMYRDTFWGQGGGPIVYGGMSAIDEALLDIKGQALGVPVYELLGGKHRDALRVYANDWYRGCNSPASYAEAAQRTVADGFDALKFDPFAVTPAGEWRYPLRALTREQADLAYARVSAVREAVGPAVDILIEVHGNLGTTAAIQMGQRFEELAPFFYEEPVDAMNYECMKKVAANVNIPIAAGERLYTRYGFRPYIEEQILDILQPDIGLAGGLTETKKIADYAETYNIHVQPHNCAGPVATAAAVQLDMAMANFIIQEWFPYRPKDHYAWVQEALEPQAKNGQYVVPATPGLGVKLDEAVIGRYDCLVIE